MLCLFHSLQYSCALTAVRSLLILLLAVLLNTRIKDLFDDDNLVASFLDDIVRLIKNFQKNSTSKDSDLVNEKKLSVFCKIFHSKAKIEKKSFRFLDTFSTTQIFDMFWIHAT